MKTIHIIIKVHKINTRFLDFGLRINDQELKVST